MANNTILNAANRQGNGIMNNVTTGSSGSGIVIGGRGGATTPIVGPGTSNPLGRAQDRVVNSLLGTGSLNAKNVHIGSIQKNVNEAMSIAKQFNNTELQQHLKNAQDAMNRASKLTGSQQSLALLSAQESLKGAGYQLQQMGYGHSKLNFQASTPTIGNKGGATAGIVGPGGTKPTTGIGGGATSPIVGPGGMKPKEPSIGGSGGASSPILRNKSINR